jgi:hypothetical protein
MPCAKIGFTQLRRRRYGAPAARRHEAGSLSHRRKTKKFLKNEKELQGQKLAHRFFESLSDRAFPFLSPVHCPFSSPFLSIRSIVSIPVPVHRP